MSTVEPQSRWVLPIGDGRTISRAVARRAPRVAPEVIETALVTATRTPPTNPRCARRTPVVYGFDASRRVVITYLPTGTAGLVGEQAAAVTWLSGAPKAEWVRTDPHAAER